MHAPAWRCGSTPALRPADVPGWLVTGRLRIAHIGQRGVPATYGGIEHHVEELGSRGAAAGHEVTVFCRPGYSPVEQQEYRGMHLVHLSTVSGKHGEATIHCARSAAMTLAGDYDIVHFHALGPGLFTPLARMRSTSRVVQTIHGLDGDRAKWDGTARRVLHAGEWMSARVPHATVVVSQALGEHYRRQHNRPTVHIPNGVTPPQFADRALVDHALGLEGRPYILSLGRLVPEKAPDVLLEAFSQVPGDVAMVLAGGSSNTDDFVAGLDHRAQQDSRVRLPGYVYGELKAALYSNAACFVLPSLLEGLPLTLLEAVAYGLPVVASRIEPHVEVLGGQSTTGRRLVPAGQVQPLAAAMRDVLADPQGHRAAAEGMTADITRRYSWDRSWDDHEKLYQALVAA